MPPINWTIHDIPLWLPDQWTGLDDLLFAIADTIKEYNESLTLRGSRPAATREDYELKSIKWSPWRTLVWLWSVNLVVMRGRRSYRDPAQQIIDAVLTERSTRLFAYDGDHVRHLASGDVWYAPEVLDAAAFAVELSQGELSFSAKSTAPDNPAQPGSRPGKPRRRSRAERRVDFICEFCRKDATGTMHREMTPKEAFKALRELCGEGHPLLQIAERQQDYCWQAVKQRDPWSPTAAI